MNETFPLEDEALELLLATQERLMNTLPAEQKAGWKELTGEPFRGEVRRPRFGSGNPLPAGGRCPPRF